MKKSLVSVGCQKQVPQAIFLTEVGTVSPPRVIHVASLIEERCYVSAVIQDQIIKFVLLNTFYC